MRDKIFYFSIISFLVGIISFELLFEKQFFLTDFIFYLILVLIIFISIFTYFKFFQIQIPNIFLLSFFIIFFFSIGYSRSFIFDKNNQGEFDYLIGQKIKKEMIIDDEVEQRDYKQKIIVKFPDSNSRAVLWNRGRGEYTYGDKILVEGYLLKPENFKTDNGNDFNYVSFLKKSSIFYEIKPIKITYLSSGNGNFIKQKLFGLKRIFLNQIKKLVPEPEASLLGGLILGAKEDLGKDLLEDFRRTGVIHMVVLSGYNLSLVADFFMKILAFFGLTISSIFGSIAIILFTIMTGASATIIRAALMALLIIFAKNSGRQAASIRALFIAGFLMLLFNPMLLLYDPSFQLSFLATLGLILLSPKIENIFSFIPKTKLDFRGILAATLSTQIFVLPLILYMMGSVSIVSPVVNILILVFVPLTMFLGFLAVVSSFFVFPIASILAFLTSIFLSYDLILVRYFSDLPFAIFEYKAFTINYLLIIYFIYFLIWLWYKKLSKKKKNLI